MLSEDESASKMISYGFPETTVKIDIDGNLVIRQQTWDSGKQSWRTNTVTIPKNFIDLFVNGVCDVVGVM